MKTCVDCEHFIRDTPRSEKLGEPIGICKLNHTWTIGYFNAEEDCDGFDGKVGEKG